MHRPTGNLPCMTSRANGVLIESTRMFNHARVGPLSERKAQRMGGATVASLTPPILGSRSFYVLATQ
jgi:hypothetical protein